MKYNHQMNAMSSQNSVFSNQQLPAQLTILFLTFIIIMTWILARHEQDKINTQFTQNMDISTWLLKERLDSLTVHPALDELSPAELINIQIQMNRLRQALHCKLYLIDKKGRLIITDLHGGPMQTQMGQHLQHLPALKNAMGHLLHGANSATYTAPDGLHQIQAISLSSPDILLIGDIPRPSLYQSFKYPANIFALLGLSLTGTVWYITRKNCRKWQKQSLAQTIIDPLTNLPNRKGFNLLIRQLFRTPGTPPPFQSILLINLDQFTQVNLHHGISAGDLLLQQLSATLNQLLPRPNTVSRWDGNEFIILLHHAETEDATVIAEKIQTTIQQQTFNVSGEHLTIHMSIGIHTRQTQDTPQTMLTQSITALHLAKQDGGNCIRHS